MKPTGFIELLIIVVTLVAGLPLFVACVIMSQRDMGLTYINDKSTWAMEPDYVRDHVDTDGDGHPDKYILIPEGFTPLNISIEQAAVMAYVQDEYGVPTARKVYYKWSADRYDIPLVDWTQESNPNAADYNWSVPYRQRAARVGVNNATDAVAAIAKKDTVLSKIDNEYYMVWNSEINNWMVTEHAIQSVGIVR